MKERVRSIGIALILGLGASVFVTGCASTKHEKVDDEQAHAYSEGMMCPECETVWVTERKKHGSPRIISRLSYERKMACPQCDKMARSQLLEDGQVMLHDCPMCKVTPRQIQAVDRPKYLNPRH